MKSRKIKKQKMFGKNKLREAKKIIFSELEQISRNFSLKHTGCSLSENFDPKKLDIMQIHHLLEMFGVDGDQFDKDIYDLLKPIDCECTWPDYDPETEEC